MVVTLLQSPVVNSKFQHIFVQIIHYHQLYKIQYLVFHKTWTFKLIANKSSLQNKQETSRKNKVIYTCNGILFSLKKEGNSDICYAMDEPWGHCEISQVSLSERTQSSQILRQKWLSGAGSSCLTGVQFQFHWMKKFWRSVVQQCKCT